MEQSDKNDNGTDKEEEQEYFDINDYREDIDSEESYETFDENDGENNDDEYTGPILPGGHRFDKKLLCVKYPGIVENPEKAIETLGGIGALSAAHDTPNRRLELRFRPQDGYCKPTCGDRHDTAGFLIRVRVKKSRVRRMQQTETEANEKLDFDGPYDRAKLEKLLGSLGKSVNSRDSTKIIDVEIKEERIEDDGIVDKLADSVDERCNVVEETQNILPISEKTSSTEPNIQEREILCSKSTEKCVPSKQKNAPVNRDVKSQDDLSKDENYQVPASKVIGRVETAFDFQNLCDFQFLAIGKSVTDPKIEEYIYESIYPVEIPPYSWLKNKVPYFLPPPAFSRMDSVQQFSLKTENDKGPKNVIGKTRKRRAGFSNFINFSSPETPCEPPPGIETAMRIKFLQKSHLERMLKIFDERPVWSKNALMSVTNFTGEQLKFLLPSVAYYFMTGPWRIMWVKLGYDPRKDPQARKYQTLDYRLRAMHGLEFTVNRKRTLSEYTLPYKSTTGMKSRTTILTNMQDERTGRKKEQLLKEATYIYREGVVPPSRQMFYQYCDIHVPEIQQMLAKLPDHLPPGAKCHEKRGWLPSGFGDQCREIINCQVRGMLRRKMNIPEDHPTALPPKRLNKNTLRLNRFTAQESSKNRNRKKRKEPEVTEDENLVESAETTKKTKSSPSPHS